MKTSFLTRTTNLVAQPRTRLFVPLILSTVLAFGCGNDTESNTGGTGGSGGSGGSTGTGGIGGTGGTPIAPSGPAVLCSLVFTPTGATGFIRLVPEAEIEAGDIDATDDAIEVQSGSCAVWKNAVFSASFESPNMTRYDAVDGELVEGDTVSFMNFGLTSLASTAEQIRIISDTKAYFFDTQFAQLIVWNPTTMTTVEAIPLTGFEAPEGLTLQRIRTGNIGDRMVFWSLYANAEGAGVPYSVFGFLNTETDEFVTDTIENCGGFLSAFVTTPNGDAYFGSTPGGAVNHALGINTISPCAVRVRAGATEVDDTFLADLNQLTGLPTGGPVGGSGDKGYLVAYDENAIPLDPLLTSSEHLALENWRIYEFELGSTSPAMLVEELPADTGIYGFDTFDGRGFLSRSKPETSTDTWFDLSQSPIRETLRFNGSVRNFARLGEE